MSRQKDLVSSQRQRRVTVRPSSPTSTRVGLHGGPHLASGDPALHLCLAALAAAGFFAFDGSSVGLAVSLATALGGPLIEVALVALGGGGGAAAGAASASDATTSLLHTYIYVDADVLGVDSWIPWVLPPRHSTVTFEWLQL